MSVLLVDGDNLLTIGFYGVKNYFYKGRHFGAIYHFLNTLRKSFDKYHLNKICVFWDGEDASITRRKLYHQYKVNRKERVQSEEEKSSYLSQRNRVKQYLEELFVRQGEFQYCETDDCIAYYSQNSPNEHKIVYSSDADLTQLVTDNTSLYNPSHKRLYVPNDMFLYHRQEILIENIRIIKTICGDPSDNIYGIRNLGLGRLLTFMPELRTEISSIEKVKEKFNLLHEEDKNNKTVNNLLTGVTKYGVLGEEFFEVNNMIVNLTNPILTDEAKENINILINDEIDPEGRSYKNALKMMMEDGIFQALPKSDDALLNFINPYLRLIRKEKNNRIIKVRNHE